MRNSFFMQPFILLFAFLFSSCRLLSQADLNAQSSFYGFWEGKITFKAFSATQDMNIEVQKGKMPGFVTLIVFHSKENNLKNDTIQSGFENGSVKMEMSAKSTEVGKDFCKGFLNIVLLDENNMNGSFETDSRDCTAVEFFAKRREKKLINPTDKLSDPIVNTPEEAVNGQAESELIKACANGKILVKKSLHEIKLQNGKSIFLKNDLSESENYKAHTFTGCINEMNMYIFNVAGWEWGSTLLINKINGNKYELLSDYVISPDKTKLITYAMADGYEYDQSYVFIYAYKNGQLIQEYTVSPKTWGPMAVKWVDNNTIAVSTGKYNAVADELKPLSEKKLIYSAGKWLLK
jgi:hypothetical protein